MKILPVVDSLDTVAKELQGFYEKQGDGKFHLQISGTPTGFVSAAEHATTNAKLVEFRDNNIKMIKELEDLRPKVKMLEGLDVDAAKKALARVKELEDAGVKDKDGIAAMVKAQVEAATKPLTEQITTLTTRNADLDKRASDAVRRAKVGEAFTKAGGEPSALDYIVGKSDGVFQVKDGNLVAVEGRFSPTKPADPLGVDEWMGMQAKESGFAFKPSGGGGAEGGKPNGGVVRNPNQTVIKNPTPQQLGQYAADVQAGKVRFEYDQ